MNLGFPKILSLPVKKTYKIMKSKKKHKITLNCNKNVKIWGLQKVVSSVQKKSPPFFLATRSFSVIFTTVGQTFFLLLIDGVGNSSCNKRGMIWLKANRYLGHWWSRGSHVKKSICHTIHTHNVVCQVTWMLF